MIYLDTAATSLLKPSGVEQAVVRAMRTMASPGRGAHAPAISAADTVFECRELVGELFNYTDTERIVFTVNATHALNIAIRSIVHRGDRVLISGYEHNSVTRTLKSIGAETDAVSTMLFDPQASLEGFSERIVNADAVICNHISNVFGYIQPVSEIAELCRRHNKPLIIDASQSAGVTDIDAKRLNAAYIAMPGHKGLMGPQGTGVLLCGQDPEPILFGGTGSDSRLQTMPEQLPDRLEAGTHNVPGIAGLSEGIKYLLWKGPKTIGRYEQELCSVMAERLKRSDELEVFASDNGSQSGVLSIRHRRMSPEELCERMGAKGIAARCGLHCAPLAHETAGTLETGTVRLSFSPFISRKQILTAAGIIEKIIVYEK